ncbi:hypothetical protein ACUY4R_004520 [Kosakonia sp. BK9b]
MLTVLHMHQLTTVAASDIRHNKVLNGLIFRVSIVVGTARQTNTDAPVHLAVCAIDIVDDMVRNQNVAIVNRHVPFNRIALQITKMTVGNAHAIQLIMIALTQDRVVCFGDGDLVDHQVTHHPFFFAANVNLHHRPIAAHRYAFDDAVRAAHIQRNVVEATAVLANDAATILQDKTTAAAALQGSAYQQRFACRYKNPGVDIFTHQACGDLHRLPIVKGLLQRRRPVVIIVLTDINGAAPRDRTRGRRVQKGQSRQG